MLDNTIFAPHKTTGRFRYMMMDLEKKLISIHETAANSQPRTQALFSFLVKTKKESRQIYIDQLLIEQARGGVSTADLYTFVWILS